MSDLANKFLNLVSIIARLRDPNGGCPWDLKQTHGSLRPYFIEEAYETADAIDDLGSAPESYRKLAEELGDVLLQVLLHSQIASESGHFSLHSVVTGLADKLVSLHPHVFGDAAAADAEAVVKRWEEIKQKEQPAARSAIDGVPRSMPSLRRAHLLGEKAARVGFDWEDSGGVLRHVLEEMGECLAETERGGTSTEHTLTSAEREELGDLWFSLVQWTRKRGENPDDILHAACEKFSRRFKKLEGAAAKPLSELPREELERLWGVIKKDQSS